MIWLGGANAVTGAAAGAMIRLATGHQPRRIRYGLPVVMVFAATGLALALPLAPTRTLFDLLLLPVLTAALGFGLVPGLFTVIAGIWVGTLALPPVGLPFAYDAQHPAMSAMYLGEGVLVTLIAAAVRSAVQTLGSREEVDEVAPEITWQRVGPLLVERLTPREAEILRLAASGRGVDQLACELTLSPNTVKTHLAHCYDKLGAHNRAEAVAFAIRAGCLNASDLEPAPSDERNHPGG